MKKTLEEKDSKKGGINTEAGPPHVGLSMSPVGLHRSVAAP